ncbi:MAG: hypothetical protein EZS28_010368, partial [Streblomastix strix]
AKMNKKIDQKKQQAELEKLRLTYEKGKENDKIQKEGT